MDNEQDNANQLYDMIDELQIQPVEENICNDFEVPVNVVCHCQQKKDGDSFEHEHQVISDCIESFEDQADEQCTETAPDQLENSNNEGIQHSDNSFQACSMRSEHNNVGSEHEGVQNEPDEQFIAGLVELPEPSEATVARALELYYEHQKALDEYRSFCDLNHKKEETCADLEDAQHAYNQCNADLQELTQSQQKIEEAIENCCQALNALQKLQKDEEAARLEVNQTNVKLATIQPPASSESTYIQLQQVNNALEQLQACKAKIEVTEKQMARHFIILQRTEQLGAQVTAEQAELDLMNACNANRLAELERDIKRLESRILKEQKAIADDEASCQQMNTIIRVLEAQCKRGVEEKTRAIADIEEQKLFSASQLYGLQIEQQIHRKAVLDEETLFFATAAAKLVHQRGFILKQPILWAVLGAIVTILLILVSYV